MQIENSLKGGHTAMIERGKTIIRIMELIDREKRNSRRYCEINPQDTERRKQREQLVISAYIEVMHLIAE
jgi:hypothetical protein